MKTAFLSFFLFVFGYAAAIPPETVSFVDLSKYGGTWYEIARYTHWFEKGMTHVTAEYIPEKDYIRVINRGIKKGKLKEVKGKAFVTEASGNAKLKVQFFWPFKSDYWIIGLDPDYRWAVVSNKSKSTLWILSRTPEMDKTLLSGILNSLKKNGFDINKLEFTLQD